MEVQEILKLRELFKNKITQGDVVKQLSHLSNKNVSKILGIGEKYYASLKTKYNCNYYQRKYNILKRER